MSRTTFIRGPESGNQREVEAYPIAIGGPDAAIDIPGSEEALAYIGESDGHVFIQAVQTHTTVWHRHEQLQGSSWLKSGDSMQIGEVLIAWSVQGEQAFADVGAAQSIDEPVAAAPQNPAPIYEPQLSAQPERTGGRPGLILAVGLVFLLLLSAVAYVLSATAYQVTIEPLPEELKVEGFPPPFSLGGRALAIAGKYRLSAAKPGYQPLEKTIAIQAGAENHFRFVMQKLPGRVTLVTEPADASLVIAGQSRGKGPLAEMSLQAGTHRLDFSAPGYLPLQTEIEVTGLDQAQTFTFALEKNSAPVTIGSLPVGATIYAGDTALGQTPAELDLAAGLHELRLELAGYQPHKLAVEVKARQPQDLGEIKLRKPDALLKIAGTQGMTVTRDGKYLGSTPLQVSLPPEQPLTLAFSKAGYQSVTRKLRLQPGEEKPIEITLKPEYGIVFIQAFPADAELLVDGKSRGPASTRLKLPTRPHRLEVRKSGYRSYVGTVTPKASGSQTLKVNLKSTQKRVPRAKAPKLKAAQGQTLIRLDPKTAVTLGSSRREQGRRSNERQRKVGFKRPFYIADKEVTNKLFRAFKSSHRSGSGDADRDDRAVSQVSWDDAARYMNWLSKKDGLPVAFEEVNGKMRLKRPITVGYRFPTESEWAYAARFAKRSSPDRYPWSGTRFPPFNASGNYADSTAQGQLGAVLKNYTDGFATVAPPGSFRPNAAGFYDFGGNVAEWCLDYYAIALTATTKTETDPSGPVSGRHHVVRGSSWKDATISELRLSYRNYSDKPRDDLGFRIARYAE